MVLLARTQAGLEETDDAIFTEQSVEVVPEGMVVHRPPGSTRALSVSSPAPSAPSAVSFSTPADAKSPLSAFPLIDKP